MSLYVFRVTLLVTDYSLVQLLQAAPSGGKETELR